MRILYENKTYDIIAWEANMLSPDLHLHHHIELVIMDEGSVKATADIIEETIERGDIFLAFPNQLHMYRGEFPLRSRVYIFSPDIVPEFGHIFAQKIPSSPRICASRVSPRALSALAHLFELARGDDVYSRAQVRGELLVLLGELFYGMDFSETSRLDLDSMRDVLIYCSKNYMRSISLSDVSDALHISRYYISHLFSQKLGLGFCEYINMLRVSLACRMLAEGSDSITEIAFAAGFNSPRSLNRAFLKDIGATPSEYRRMSRLSK